MARDERPLRFHWWRRVVRTALAVAAMAALSWLGQEGIAVSAPQGTDRTGRASSWELTPETVQRLEAGLAERPHDLEARTRLLKHFFMRRSDERRTARAPHVLWVIANAPDSELAGSPLAGFDRHLEPEGYDAARALWLKHVEARGKDARVLGNAAAFFLIAERGRAQELLSRAAELEPANPEWRERLGRLHMLDARQGDTSADPGAAKDALDQFESALRNTTGTRERYYALADVAESALAAGDDGKARQYASELLRLAEELPRDWNLGNAVHEGHRILGHVALNAGDVAGAKAHLLKAGATNGSPQLDSFGPELTLAQALLERGERETVIDYLKLCSRFWEGRGEALDRWIAQIRAGETPQLNRFHAHRPGAER